MTDMKCCCETFGFIWPALTTTANRVLYPRT